MQLLWAIKLNVYLTRWRQLTHFYPHHDNDWVRLSQGHGECWFKQYVILTNSIRISRKWFCQHVQMNIIEQYDCDMAFSCVKDILWSEIKSVGFIKLIYSATILNILTSTSQVPVPCTITSHKFVWCLFVLKFARSVRRWGNMRWSCAIMSWWWEMFKCTDATTNTLLHSFKSSALIW